MARGSAPGERRGGRQKGTPNKATREIRAAAQKHGKSAIAKLVEIMGNDANPVAQIAAIKELLNRGYGQSTANVSVDGDIAHHHNPESVSETAAFIAAAIGTGENSEAEESMPGGSLLSAPVRLQ